MHYKEKANAVIRKLEVIAVDVIIGRHSGNKSQYDDYIEGLSETCEAFYNLWNKKEVRKLTKEEEIEFEKLSINLYEEFLWIC